MPSVKEMSSLLQAIGARDLALARTEALKLADAEISKGNHRAASLIRSAVSESTSQPNGRTAELESVQTTGILSRLPESAGLSHISMRSARRHELEDLLTEWRHRDLLQKDGVGRRRKVLFHGPPGCGKSLAARAIAHEAQLPAYVVQLDAVIGAYLGQTALRIRELFRFAEIAPSVLLLDEVDALGRERGNAMDVGEVDRVVISIMQQMEHSSPAGFLIATSNLPGRLDPALVRRFDLVLEFSAPTKAERARFFSDLAKRHSIPVTPALRSRLLSARSFADVERVALDARRRNLLEQGGD